MTRRRGMTLLELAVALVVGGAAMAAGGAVFATLVDHRAALLASADADVRALAARRALVAWITQLRADDAGLDALTGLHGTQRTPNGEVQDDAFSFVTHGGDRAERVRVYIDRTNAPPALVADRMGMDGAVTRVVLAPDVDGLDVSYLTTAFGRREWRRSWAGALRPSAVRLQLRVRDGTQLPAPLAMPITIVVANGR